MNISLTPELERFVHDKVDSGMYTSASEVIRESLRLLHTHDDLLLMLAYGNLVTVKKYLQKKASHASRKK
jgi:antitoxin ParD1/3/4